MDVKTYRARNIQEALSTVRRELGPDASVLHTREVQGGWLRRMIVGREIEVTASADVELPSSLPAMATSSGAPTPAPMPSSPAVPPADETDYRARFRDGVKSQVSDLESMVEDLCRQATSRTREEVPESFFHIYTDLIDAEICEDQARSLIHRVREELDGGDLNDPMLVKARMARMVEDDIRTQGPIQVTPGQRKIVALVGPTGVGKTTTIAKLAANFRLREKRRVGLITVDTYRIAAVEQLRTYADIIDLPMEVVSTPREMREAVARLSDLDLILMDTAGRSPRDEVRIQELRSMLAEAQADEVHLVLSGVASANVLKKTTERFAEVGVTALLLTKLDEATGLGNLLPVVRSSCLPLGYVTNGQNVPDDIQVADSPTLARVVLGIDQA